jgi:hypothetical protein
MSLFLDSINNQSKVFSPNITSSQEKLAYIDGEQFVLSPDYDSSATLQSLQIRRSINNGISWNITTPISSTGSRIVDIGGGSSTSLSTNGKVIDGLHSVFVLTYIFDGGQPLYRIYDLLRMETPGASPNYIGFGTFLNGIGAISYYNFSTNVFNIKILSGITYAIPSGAGNVINFYNSKSYSVFPQVIGARLWFVGSNWWTNASNVLVSSIGVTTFSTPIYEARGENRFTTPPQSTTSGQIVLNDNTALAYRENAFAFANNYTKIVKFFRTRVSQNISYVVEDSNYSGPPIQEAAIDIFGRIWIVFNESGEMRRFFSPNFGGEWIELSTLPPLQSSPFAETPPSFKISADGRYHTYKTTDGIYISTNYGY